jgi:hypothetical protein
LPVAPLIGVRSYLPNPLRRKATMAEPRSASGTENATTYTLRLRAGSS